MIPNFNVRVRCSCHAAVRRFSLFLIQSGFTAAQWDKETKKSQLAGYYARHFRRIGMYYHTITIRRFSLRSKEAESDAAFKRVPSDNDPCTQENPAVVPIVDSVVDLKHLVG